MAVDEADVMLGGSLTMNRVHVSPNVGLQRSGFLPETKERSELFFDKVLVRIALVPLTEFSGTILFEATSVGSEALMLWEKGLVKRSSHTRLPRRKQLSVAWQLPALNSTLASQLSHPLTASLLTSQQCSSHQSWSQLASSTTAHPKAHEVAGKNQA